MKRSPSFHIRPARSDDAPAIARVHVDSWRSTYRGFVPDSVLDTLDYESREHFWRDEIADTTKDQFIHVAEAEDDRIAGFVSGGTERTGDYPDFTGEIYALYVADNQHGNGLGRKLFEAGVRSLDQQGHRSMLIWALSENPACGFYRHLDGVEIAKQQITVGQKVLEETAFGWEYILVLLDP